MNSDVFDNYGLVRECQDQIRVLLAIRNSVITVDTKTRVTRTLIQTRRRAFWPRLQLLIPLYTSKLVLP